MSALYHVRIDHVRGTTVHFRVTTFHPDAGPPPAAATFPMNLLIDLWTHLERGYVSLIEGCTLTADEAPALARDPAYGPRIEALHHLTFGRSATCSAADVAELNRRLEAGEPCEWRGQAVSGWALAGDASQVFLPGDPDAFAAQILPLVAAHGIDEQENQSSYSDWPDDWPSTARLPRARVRLELTDPTLLGFVRQGWAYETASCF